MTRTVEADRPDAPLHERRTTKQKVERVEVFGVPYATKQVFTRDDVIAQWEQLPPAERILTNAQRKELKEANRVGVRNSARPDNAARIIEATQQWGGGAVLDQDELKLARKTIKAGSTDDAATLRGEQRLSCAHHTLAVHSLIDGSRRKSINEGELRVLVDLEGNQLNIPLNAKAETEKVIFRAAPRTNQGVNGVK